MRQEPSNSRLMPSSSSQGSRCSRRLEFPVENIRGVVAAGRRRKRPAGRSRLGSYRSYSCYRNCRNRSCRRRCSCRNRENRGWDNRGSHGFENRGWNNCVNRYSNSLELVDNLNLELAGNWNLGPADRRLLAGRRPGPSWRRPRDPGSDQARRRAESGPCCLGRICCILRKRKIARRMRLPELEQMPFC